MTEPRIGTREQHDAARKELLQREKELTRASDELARQRRELPWVPIEKEYSFDTDAGEETLAELFDGRSQLLIYHFMFGPAYKRRMGWSFPWASSADDFNPDFGAAYTEPELKPFLDSGQLGPVPAMAAQCGTDPAGYLSEAPVLNAFALAGGAIHHTYSTTARGLEVLMGYYGMLDRVPSGRNEAGETDMWIRRHDEYA